MPYKLNRKNFAATRIMPSDPSNKYAYLHVSNKGTVCLDGFRMVRVSLPDQEGGAPSNAAIFTPDIVEQKRTDESGKDVTMPDGLPAKSTGTHSVPIFDNAMPDPSQMGQSIILDGRALIELLKVACDVTDHARNLVRLSIQKSGGILRIDTHRVEGDQEFCGIQVAVQYKGNNIPGLPQAGEEKTLGGESIDAKNLSLPLFEGRKFRE